MAFFTPSQSLTWWLNSKTANGLSTSNFLLKINSSTHLPPSSSVSTTSTLKTLSMVKYTPKISYLSMGKSNYVTGLSHFRKTFTTLNLKTRIEPNPMITLLLDKFLHSSLPLNNPQTPLNPKMSTLPSNPSSISTAKTSSLPYWSSSKTKLNS